MDFHRGREIQVWWEDDRSQAPEHSGYKVACTGERLEKKYLSAFF